MKVRIDEQADALYLGLSDAPAARSEELAPGVIVDFDARGEAVGVEVLHLSKRATPIDWRQILVETVPLAA